VAGAVHGVAVISRHRAEAAADLAALAGARSVIDGSSEACAHAATVAAANGAQLVHCGLSGDVIDIEVAVDLRLGRIGRWVVTGRARAGPAEQSASSVG
jgi:secretion/DNA translocation related TadE-like protein